MSAATEMNGLAIFVVPFYGLLHHVSSNRTAFRQICSEGASGTLLKVIKSRAYAESCVAVWLSMKRG